MRFFCIHTHSTASMRYGDPLKYLHGIAKLSNQWLTIQRTHKSIIHACIAIIFRQYIFTLPWSQLVPTNAAVNPCIIHDHRTWVVDHKMHINQPTVLLQESLLQSKVDPGVLKSTLRICTSIRIRWDMWTAWKTMIECDPYVHHDHMLNKTSTILGQAVGTRSIMQQSRCNESIGSRPPANDIFDSFLQAPNRDEADRLYMSFS